TQLPVNAYHLLATDQLLSTLDHSYTDQPSLPTLITSQTSPAQRLSPDTDKPLSTLITPTHETSPANADFTQNALASPDSTPATDKPLSYNAYHLPHRPAHVNAYHLITRPCQVLITLTQTKASCQSLDHHTDFSSSKSTPITSHRPALAKCLLITSQHPQPHNAPLPHIDQCPCHHFSITPDTDQLPVMTSPQTAPLNVDHPTDQPLSTPITATQTQPPVNAGSPHTDQPLPAPVTLADHLYTDQPRQRWIYLTQTSPRRKRSPLTAIRPLSSPSPRPPHPQPPVNASSPHTDQPPATPTLISPSEAQTSPCTAPASPATQSPSPLVNAITITSPPDQLLPVNADHLTQTAQPVCHRWITSHRQAASCHNAHHLDTQTSFPCQH
ncbi:mucin-2-like, partial [Haliotis rubra]|uniref:mucin-2-like n=1 Tax=Haliotis rubra TaxID=36100 RepID=UPI001EE61088